MARIRYLSTALGLVTLLVVMVTKLWSSIYGVPPGYTGSPVDGITCATMGCHRGPVSTVNGWITTDVPAAGYQPADTYTVTLTASRPATTRFGFQMATQGVSGTEGGFVVTDPLQTQLSQGTGYITHKETGTTGNNQKSWQCKWVAPSDPSVTSVTLYAAVVTGVFDVDDEVFKTSLALFQGPQAVPEAQAEPRINCWPNPFANVLQIMTIQPGNSPVTLEVFLHNGQLFRELTLPCDPAGTYRIDTRDWPLGVLWIRVNERQILKGIKQ
ncbi:MAG TPA: hypothetical protein P5228_08730 [Bacteroidales bacterium]|nr:hypothetical protein [Bacteroidales bacterium]HRZ47945.1 hypothetical protein [Bacteroidales bacterium]